MLIEWLHHRATPCDPKLKRMGYLKELIALGARYRRCRHAWAPHLALCQNLILQSMDGIPHGRVTVLGSGFLLDIPLKALAETFDEVELVDILHMPEVKKRTRVFPNVRLVETDLSGVADATWDYIEQGQTGPLPAPRINAGFCVDSDLVVSANLLSQLPLTPMGWLKKKGYGEGDIQTFARAVFDHHLEFLSALPGRVCLITETRQMIMDGDEILEEIDPLFGADLPLSGKKWIWNVALRPEVNRNIDLRYHITGISDYSNTGG
ncbi:MAG: hypothetical protein H8E39_03070 [Alphaproteobacteria bacterium]|nr:hypothetical protein [Alphaproteobacteria bacterium]